MEKCPICEVKVNDTFDYCRNCAWEFEYYFDELTEAEKDRYTYRLKSYTEIYQKSIIVYKEKIVNKSEIVIIDDLRYQNQFFTRVYNWNEAQKYAKNLRPGGYDNWRIPTKKELNKLISKERNNGKNGVYYIRKEFINNLKRYAWFWTSKDNSLSEAWVVNFTDGHGNYFGKKNTHYVMCVSEE